MRFIPQIVLPFAIASLIQEILGIHSKSAEGSFVFLITLLGWYYFVNKTARGRMVYDAWVVDIPGDSDSRT